MFLYSFTASGSIQNKRTLIETLAQRGYKLYFNSIDHIKEDSVVTVNGSKQYPNLMQGKIDYWPPGRFQERMFEFNLDQDLELAISIASQRTELTWFKGEWARISRFAGHNSSHSWYNNSGEKKVFPLHEDGNNHIIEVEEVEGDTLKLNNTSYRASYAFKATASELIEYFKNNPQTKVMATKTTFTVEGSKYLKSAFLSELHDEVGLVRTGGDPISDGKFIYPWGKGYGVADIAEKTHYILPQDWVSAKTAFVDLVKGEGIKVPLSAGYWAIVFKDYLLLNGKEENTISRADLEPFINPSSLIKDKMIFSYEVSFATFPDLQIGCTRFPGTDLVAIREAFRTASSL